MSAEAYHSARGRAENNNNIRVHSSGLAPDSSPTPLWPPGGPRGHKRETARTDPFTSSAPQTGWLMATQVKGPHKCCQVFRRTAFTLPRASDDCCPPQRDPPSPEYLLTSLRLWDDFYTWLPYQEFRADESFSGSLLLINLTR